MVEYESLVLSLDARQVEQGFRQASAAGAGFTTTTRAAAASVDELQAKVKALVVEQERLDEAARVSGGFADQTVRYREVTRELEAARSSLRSVAQAQTDASVSAQKHERSLLSMEGVTGRVEQKLTALNKAAIGFVAVDLVAKVFGFNSAMDALNKATTALAEDVNKLSTQYREDFVAALDISHGKVKALREELEKLNSAKRGELVDVGGFTFGLGGFNRAAAGVDAFAADASRSQLYERIAQFEERLKALALERTGLSSLRRFDQATGKFVDDPLYQENVKRITEERARAVAVLRGEIALLTKELEREAAAEQQLEPFYQDAKARLRGYDYEYVNYQYGRRDVGARDGYRPSFLGDPIGVVPYTVPAGGGTYTNKLDDTVEKIGNTFEDFLDDLRRARQEDLEFRATGDSRSRLYSLLGDERGARERLYGRGLSDADITSGKKPGESLADYEQRLAEADKNMNRLVLSTERWGAATADAVDAMIFGGASAKEAFAQLVLQIERAIVQAAVLKLVQFAIIPAAKGEVFQGGEVVPFAYGGVLAQPTYFPLAGNKVGLAGEAGPEAVVPLKRGADGKLGIGSSGATRSVTVVQNFYGPADQSAMRLSARQTYADLRRLGA